jgi:hypothetical protein
VNTYIKTIEIDNINPDNFINGSAMWLYSVVGWCK